MMRPWFGRTDVSHISALRMVKLPSCKYPQRVPVTMAWGALSRWLRVIVGSCE